MASFSLNASGTFTDGTSVGAYLRSQWGVEGLTGAPTGGAVASGTVSGGTVAFTGLADSTEYIAYASSPNRYERFRTAAGPTSDSGQELGYAEITSNFTTSTQSAATDVTGLTITVTVGARPIFVEFFTSQFFHSAASAAPSLRLLEDGAIVQVANSSLPTAGGGPPSHMRVRRAPAAGSHTYKVQVFQGASPVGTITVQGGATAPAFIRAIES